MHRRSLALVILVLAIAPTGSDAAPAARKGTATSAGPKAKPATKGAKSKFVPRRVVRSDALPAPDARVKRKPVSAPAATLVPSEAARKPVKLGAFGRKKASAITPCGASLPEQAPRPTIPAAGMDAAVFERAYRWPTGATLSVGFLDGSRQAREATAQIAKQWTDHANLKLDFSLDDPPPNPDILITFDSSGCTSYVGTSSRYYAEMGMASMNLCHMDQWYDANPSVVPEQMRRVVLHEFGHAIGLHHEHQSPEAGFDWNYEAVYAYYGNYGWSRDYVDMWVFRQLSAVDMDASAYDPDSVMHYSFPAEFTKQGVAFGGKSELSKTDREHIAKMYPPAAGKKARRYFQRKLAVRNETGTALDVQVVYQTRRTGASSWLPSDELASAPAVKVAAGAERSIDAKATRAKLVARAKDGRTWSDLSTEPVVVAPAGGYLDTELQTYVLVIDGPPDPTAAITSAQLFDQASKAMTDGDYEKARALYDDLVQRFPTDPLVPWARFDVALSWYQQSRYEEALESCYALIVDHPDAEATIYAWYYGGLSSLQLGWCEGAEAYLGYVADPSSGAPKDWQKSAQQYLDAIDGDPKRWCG